MLHETYFISGIDERGKFGKMHTHKIDHIMNFFPKTVGFLEMNAALVVDLMSKLLFIFESINVFKFEVRNMPNVCL